MFRKLGSASLILGVFLFIAGCGSSSGPTAIDESGKHIFRAQLLHQRFPMMNKGRSAKSVEDLKTFLNNLKKEDLANMGIDDPATALVSPRDNQPYVFNWSAPSHMDMMSAKGKPTGGAGGPIWIVHEQTGQGGKRYVAVSMGQIYLLDDDGFRRMVK